MTYEDAKAKYNELFDTVEKKAEAFDKIAEKYYRSNFGATSKSDFDVLMFSLYIEAILKRGQRDFSSYSDYTLSKQLGITQAKVSNLKVKKELLYPHDGFIWQQSLLSISDKALYEDGKIKLFVPDRNLYLEIKNAIEEMGGFVEVQLTSNLLQVRLAYFLDLMVAISEETSRDTLRTNIKKKIEESIKDVTVVEKEPFGKALQKQAPEMIIDIIGDCIPVFGDIVKDIAKNLLASVR